MMDVFATKEDLKALEEKLVNKDEFNRVLNLVDQVLGEVKAMRIEQSSVLLESM